MDFKISIALPVKAGNVKTSANLIEKALTLEPQFIELRWDYLEDVNSLTESFVSALMELIPPNVSLISTFRSPSEGGNTAIEEQKRMEILRMLIAMAPDYVDVEMQTEKARLRKLINLALKNDVKLIFSHHDFQKTPSYEEGKAILNEFLKELVMICTSKTDCSGPFLYKMIFTAQTFKDNLTTMHLCKHFSSQGRDRAIISFCMGDLGIFSRIACVRAGSFLTYASLTNETAPGQIDAETLRKAINLLNS